MMLSLTSKERTKNENEGELDFGTVVEKFEAIDTFELPPAPSRVNVSKPSEDRPAILWFEYQSAVKNLPVLSWEVRRYKLNKDEKWSFKSSQVFPEKGSTHKTCYKFYMAELSMEVQYRFTVCATNECGKGDESKPSNVLFIEPPLPNGWFRTKQSNLVRAQSEGLKPKHSSRVMGPVKSFSGFIVDNGNSNPVASYPSLRFIYCNFNFGLVSLHRPDIDPYFIENAAVVKMFSDREKEKLRNIFDEEILHYEKITKERFRYILLEVGERVKLKKIKGVLSELSTSGDYLTSYNDYMEAMYTFKMRSISMSTFIKAASSIFSCVGDSVQNYGLLESVGNWDIYESKVLGRKQFINRMSKKKTCNMPQEVRLSLSEDDEVYVNANEAFDPFEMELIKLSFLHLDCEHCGAVSMVEMYRYLLVSCFSSPSSEHRILPPAMLTQRKNVVEIIGRGSDSVSFKSFTSFFTELKLKDKSSTLYKKLLSTMQALRGFFPNRQSLHQNLESYLVARKQKIFEKGREALVSMGSKKSVIAPEDANTIGNDVSRGEPKSHSQRQFSLPKQESVTSMGTNEDSHGVCCFCGCREKEPDLEAMT